MNLLSCVSRVCNGRAVSYTGKAVLFSIYDYKLKLNQDWLYETGYRNSIIESLMSYIAISSTGMRVQEQQYGVFGRRGVTISNLVELRLVSENGATTHSTGLPLRFHSNHNTIFTVVQNKLYFTCISLSLDVAG